MAHCKVGDLAIIVKDDGFQENLGITVQIIRQAGCIGWYPYSKRLKRSFKRPRRLYTWEVIALSHQGICYRDCNDELFFSRDGQIPDEALQPLPKIPDNDVENMDDVHNPIENDINRYSGVTRELA